MNLADGCDGEKSLQEAFLHFRQRRVTARPPGRKKGPGCSSPDLDPEKHRTTELRQRFINTARSFVGTPYGRKHHNPEHCACEGCTEAGRQLATDPRFLDCCGLVRAVVRSLSADLGFTLGSGNQAYQFDTLPGRVPSVCELEPGDLIFYSGVSLKPGAKRFPFDMVHVEVFIGGDSGEATIGSREQRKWVQQYDSYVFQSKNWSLLQHHYVKIDSWLQGECTPAHPELWKSCARPAAKPAAGLSWDACRYSVFGVGAGSNELQEDGQQASDVDQGQEIPHAGDLQHLLMKSCISLESSFLH